MFSIFRGFWSESKNSKKLTTMRLILLKKLSRDLCYFLCERFFGSKNILDFCAGSIFRSVLVLVWLQSEWEKFGRSYWLPRPGLDQSERLVLLKRISTKICAQVHRAHLFLHFSHHFQTDLHYARIHILIELRDNESLLITSSKWPFREILSLKLLEWKQTVTTALCSFRFWVEWL